MLKNFFGTVSVPKRPKPTPEQVAAANKALRESNEQANAAKDAEWAQKRAAMEEQAKKLKKARAVLGIQVDRDGNPSGYHTIGNQTRLVNWLLFLLRWVAEWIFRDKPIEELEEGFTDIGLQDPPNWFNSNMIHGKRNKRLEDGPDDGSFNSVFEKLRKIDIGACALNNCDLRGAIVI